MVIQIWMIYFGNCYAVTTLRKTMGLRDEVIPSGLEIKKKGTFQVVTDTFKSKRKSILFNDQKNLYS